MSIVAPRLILPRTKVIKITTTYTLTPRTRALQIWAGNGGNGGADASNGGAAGNFVWDYWIVGLDGGETITVTIGAGGAYQVRGGQTRIEIAGKAYLDLLIPVGTADLFYSPDWTAVGYLNRVDRLGQPRHADSEAEELYSSRMLWKGASAGSGCFSKPDTTTSTGGASPWGYGGTSGHDATGYCAGGGANGGAGSGGIANIREHA